MSSGKTWEDVRWWVLEILLRNKLEKTIKAKKFEELLVKEEPKIDVITHKDVEFAKEEKIPDFDIDLTNKLFRELEEDRVADVYDETQIIEDISTKDL